MNIKKGPLFLLMIAGFFILIERSAAQTGINTTSPNANAALDIVSATKGLLVPRLNLTATTNPSPLSVHVQGMMVYNLATVNDVTPGMYINSGTDWRRLTTDVPQIVAHAQNTTTQTINNGAPRTNVQFNTLVRSDGNFDLSTENYTVTKAGYYRADVVLGVNPTTNNNSQIVQLNLGATPDYTLWLLSNVPPSLFVRTGSVTKYLTAGEVINFYFQPCNACTANYDLTNADIIITRISD